MKDPLPLDLYIDNLRKKIPNKYDQSLVADWGKELEEENLTHLHYLFVEANFGQNFCFSVEEDYSEIDKIKNFLNKQFGFLDSIQWHESERQEKPIFNNISTVSKWHNNFF